MLLRFHLLGVTFGDEVPIDDIEPGGDVFGTAILIFEVIGVLPDIQAEQGLKAVAQRSILVGSGLNAQFFAVDDEPGPAAAEDFGGGISEFFFEAGKVAKAFIDSLGEFAFGFAAAAFLHHLPKKRVVVMAAALVANGDAGFIG